MAGRGPVPKPSRARARDERGWQDVPSGGYDGPLIALADDYRAYEDGQPATVPFLAATRQWWERCARSPSATAWSPADFDVLRLIVAPLFDQVQRGAHGRMPELRLQLAELGLTFAARQRLRLRIDAPKPAPPSRSAVRRMRAVDHNVLGALVDDLSTPEA